MPTVMSLVDHSVVVRMKHSPDDVWVGKLTKRKNTDTLGKMWYYVESSEAGSGKGKTQQLGFTNETVREKNGNAIVLS